MTRKLAALVITILLLLGLFPATALASAPGTARLVLGANVLPGEATYAVEVASSALTINAVRVDLPAGEAGVKNSAAAITPPSGWTATKRSTVTGAETIFFRGGSIPAGSSTTFEFPASVARPYDRDVAGSFIVALSSDGGATTQQATLPPRGGTLTTTVRVLSVETIAPTAPAGVTDGTGTNGQAITFGTSVKNHAQVPLAVTPTLTIRQGNSGTGDEVGTPSPATSVINAGSTSSFSFPVQLDNPTNLDGSKSTRNLTFTGGGTATGASAMSKSSAFVSEVAATLGNFANLAPKLVRPGSTQTFSLDVTKRGATALNVTGGSLNFADTSAALKATSFGPDTQTGQLSFSGTVKGADKEYPVSVTFTGTDSNGSAFTQTSSLSDRITIDGLAPKVTLNVSLPLDGDGRPQSDAKTNDTITVNGTVDDTRAKLDFVELRPNVGPAISVPVTLANGQFTGQVKAPFDVNATSFVATGQATDIAGNSGAGASSTMPIDNISPALVGPGVTLNSTDIGSITNSDNVPGAIQVKFADNGRVKGACDPKLYSVAGNAVSGVTYGDGTACIPGEAGKDDFRLLLLTKPLRRDETPSVSYNPTPGDRAKDGAGNFAVTKTIDTISGIAPIVPELVTVFRNTTGVTDDNPCNPSGGRCETAYYDTTDKNYYTRFGGTDLIARFSGARSGYLVEVLDQNDVVLATKPVSTFTADVRIPLGVTDGSYVRKLRLVNAAGIKGGSLSFNVTLDKVAPVISSVGTPTSGATGTTTNITFSERIVKGTDFSFDWNVVELLSNGSKLYYSPDKVSGTGSSRTATFTPKDLTRFHTMAYDFQEDGGGIRYEDRAGNAMADNL